MHIECLRVPGGDTERRTGRVQWSERKVDHSARWGHQHSPYTSAAAPDGNADRFTTRWHRPLRRTHHYWVRNIPLNAKPTTRVVSLRFPRGRRRNVLRPHNTESTPVPKSMASAPSFARQARSRIRPSPSVGQRAVAPSFWSHRRTVACIPLLRDATRTTWQPESCANLHVCHQPRFRCVEFALPQLLGNCSARSSRCFESW